MSYAQPNPYAAPQYPQQYAQRPQLGYDIDARMDGDALRTANGTQLVLFTCSGGANQRWALP